LEVRNQCLRVKLKVSSGYTVFGGFGVEPVSLHFLDSDDRLHSLAYGFPSSSKSAGQHCSIILKNLHRLKLWYIFVVISYTVQCILNKIIPSIIFSFPLHSFSLSQTVFGRFHYAVFICIYEAYFNLFNPSVYFHLPLIPDHLLFDSMSRYHHHHHNHNYHFRSRFYK
jgi:hypothetical protein